MKHAQLEAIAMAARRKSRLNLCGEFWPSRFELSRFGLIDARSVKPELIGRVKPPRDSLRSLANALTDMKQSITCHGGDRRRVARPFFAWTS